MPVIRRGHGNRVDVLAIEDSTKIPVKIGFGAGSLLAKLLTGLFEGIAVHVAKGDHLHIVEAAEPVQVGLSYAPDTDDPHDDLFVGAGRLPSRLDEPSLPTAQWCAQRDTGHSHARRLEEVSSFHDHLHNWVLPQTSTNRRAVNSRISGCPPSDRPGVRRL